MTRRFLFLDEAGNLDFSLKGSRYFILTSISLDTCDIGDRLLDLRRALVWSGAELTDAFHATSDKQRVRDEVFRLIGRYDFRVDATIFEKRKTIPTRQGLTQFYDLAWFLHMKHVLPRVSELDDEIMVVSASLATKREQQILGEALRSTSTKLAVRGAILATYWPAGTDPCLQVADYCCWAIQRKWERNDRRSYDLMESKIATEFDAFETGTTFYY